MRLFSISGHVPQAAEKSSLTQHPWRLTNVAWWWAGEPQRTYCGVFIRARLCQNAERKKDRKERSPLSFLTKLAGQQRVPLQLASSYFMHTFFTCSPNSRNNSLIVKINDNFSITQTYLGRKNDKGIVFA